MPRREISALAIAPDDPGALMAQAELAEARGGQAEAMAAYRRVLALQPGHALALVKLAGILLDRGFADEADLDAAIEVCRAAIALVPNPAPAHALLGRTLLAADRAEEAVQAYRAAAALDPTNPMVFSGLALALLSSGELVAALEVAEAVTGACPGLAEGWYGRGRALLLLNQPEPATQAFVRGLQLTPGDARMHLGLGDALAQLFREEDAIQCLERAAALDPRSKWAHASLGSSYYRAGRLEPAEASCRAALALDPELAIAHRNLSGVLADLGRPAEARRHRDAAYLGRNIEIHHAPHPRARVLVLTTCDSGNIPHRCLLPADHYSRIDWFIEYAAPGQAAALPAHDVVFNIIGDPDFSGPTEAAVQAFVRQSKARVLNLPDRIPPTRRDRLPGLLEGIEGLVIPKVARLDPAEAAGVDLAAWIQTQALGFPLLLRPIGSHGGQGLTLVGSAAELSGFDASQGAYATEFCDYASPSDGRYRKYRAIFIDRRPYPYHLAIAERWLVHYASSGMLGQAERQAEEMGYLEDPSAALGGAAWEAIGAIGRRLDLDYAGADVGVLPDGRVVVFEANATMLVHPEDEGELQRKNPYVERITSAFQALVETSA
jgi:tetratricopeptide (TPR) repeat protein